jgi:ketopantoate reductase
MKANLLIVCSGALATLFAARLLAAGVNVTMLGSWHEGLAALRKSGARLNDRGGQIVQATDNPADCRGAKFALVLVKSWQTETISHQRYDPFQCTWPSARFTGSDYSWGDSASSRPCPVRW